MRMTTEPTIHVLDAPRCHLGEGPSYDPATETAWWVDILDRRLFELSLAAGAGPARVYTLPFMASCIAAIDSEHQLHEGEDGLYVRTLFDGRLTRHCALEADDPGTRTNDGRVHPSGALWIGTMGCGAERGRGAIYHVAGTRVTRLFAHLTIPNAIAFAPDGRVGYFVDSRENLLMRVALDAATGLPVAEPDIHYRHGDGGGSIDGAVVDREGVIWTARFGAACLDAYSPAGDRVRTVPVPPHQPTCPTFVGRDLDHLLVTSAYEGMDDAARRADPEHGRTVLVGIGTRGLLEPAFRLAA